MRRTQVVKITDTRTEGSMLPESRDLGKQYMITEMSAMASEKWAMRAINMLISSGMDIPAGVAGAGMAGLASIAGAILSSFQGFAWEKLEPLLDEMMTCVKVSTPIRPQEGQAVTYRAVSDDLGDIEEISTLLILRKAAIELHLGFTFADASKKMLVSAGVESKESPTQTSQTQ